MICYEGRRYGFFLVDQNNQKSIRVDGVASSNYLHAFALMDAHSNAVQKAHEFVTWLNNPTNNLTALPLQELKNLHHMTPSNRLSLFNDEAYLGFAEEIEECKVFEVSALCFYVQSRPEVGGEEVPVIALFTAKKSDPSDPLAFPILFHNGRWGFGKYW